MVFKNSLVHSAILEPTRLFAECFTMDSSGAEVARSTRRAAPSQSGLQLDAAALVSAVYGVLLRFESDGSKNNHDSENGC